MEAESSTRRRATTTKKRKSDTGDSGASAPKRARTTKVGRLAGLFTISLDVLFEIFGHLQPIDVLRLSRTSKEFRKLLMHKSSISIWTSSLKNVSPSLPACPPGMNEPQWVHLLFDATCHVCNKIVRKIDWGLYVRLCAKCIKTHLLMAMWHYLPSGTDAVKYGQLVSVRPATNKPYRSVYFDKEMQRVKAQYDAITDSGLKEKFIEERKELVKALKEHTKVCEAWAEGVAENRSTELADLKEERYTAVVAKLTDLGWGTEINNILPIDSLRNHKLIKQPHALTERIWTTIEPQIVQYMEEMKVKRLAREHAALVIVRKGIATKVLRTFKRSQLPWTDNMPMPGAPDFWEFPEIKAILHQPLEVDVDEQAFEALLLDFPKMIARWRDGLVQQLVKQVTSRGWKKGESAESTMASLQLATSVFKCVECSRATMMDYISMFMEADLSSPPCNALYWPRVLSHRCLTQSSQAMYLWFDGRATKWSASTLTHDKDVAETVERIVTACGLDPTTATVADMDALNARLACHTCAERATSVPESSKKGKSPAGDAPAQVHAYSWRNAVRHDAEVHYHQPAHYHRLGDADAAAARAAEAELLADADSPQPPPSPPDMEAEAALLPDADAGMLARALLPSELPEVIWSCAHCIDGPLEKAPMALEEMRVHLDKRHSVLAATLNADYYRSPAAPEIYGTDAHFPAPVLTVALPPAPPPLKAAPGPHWDMRLMDMMDEDDDYFW
ncbi:hypothetical protein B0H10DRAFT_2225993 [Mycena sp. CBHHK59/15]|nr:hypothetical protein B0H10DRAFT_2225993 [Mycena sp. CBHHK59/15]